MIKSLPLCAVVMALMVPPPGSAEPHSEKRPLQKLTLAVSAPLSGGGSAWGNDVKNVLLFANEKLAGGRYHFVFEDDRCDPKIALSVQRRV